MKTKPTYEELEQKVGDLERNALEHKEAERILSHERHFYESIIDSLPGAFYFFDNKGKFLRWNKNLEEITGYSTEEVSRMNPLDFFIEEDKKHVGEKIREVFNKGRSSVEASIVTKTGNTLPFYFTGLRLIMDNKSHLVGMGIEISKRKELEEALRKSEQEKIAILDSLMEHVVHQDREMKILWANRAACESAHMRQEDLIGLYCYEVWADRRSPCGDCPVIEAYRTGQPQTVEKMTPDGRWWYIQGQPVRDSNGRVTGATELTLDITERKRAEEALHKAKDELEIRIEERTAELAEANEQLRNEIEERKQAEEALRESELQKSAILDASIDRILYVDKDMRIIWANKTAAEGLNISPEDLVGQKCYRLFVGRDTLCENCPSQRAQKTGLIERAVVYKPTVKGKGGETYLDIFCSPLKNVAGNIEGFIHVSRNVTDQKLSELKILRKNALLAAINQIFQKSLICETDEEVAKICIDIAQDLTDSHVGFIAEVNDDGSLDCLAINDPGRHACQVPESGAIETMKNMKIRGYWSSVIKEKKSLIVNDTAIHPEGIRTPEGHPQITSFLGTPLLHGERTFGMIALANKESGYNVHDQEALETMAYAIVEALTSNRAKERIHWLSQNLIKTQENERQMISRELHDSVAQDLSVSKIELDMLLEVRHALNPELEPRITKISHNLNRAIDFVRNLSYYLRPTSLDQMTLTDAIYSLCKDFSEKTGLTVNFNSAGMEGLDLNYDTRINLFRLVQEGLRNAWNHAEASHLMVKIVTVYPNMILRIEDDGKGFDVEKRLRATNNERKLGLRTMEERVHLLKGHMEIQSKPMQGTKIYVKIPYIE